MRRGQAPLAGEQGSEQAERTTDILDFGKRIIQRVKGIQSADRATLTQPSHNPILDFRRSTNHRQRPRFARQRHCPQHEAIAGTGGTLARDHAITTKVADRTERTRRLPALVDARNR
jgi:hypothetical protein